MRTTTSLVMIERAVTKKGKTHAYEIVLYRNDGLFQRQIVPIKDLDSMYGKLRMEGNKRFAVRESAWKPWKQVSEETFNGLLSVWKIEAIEARKHLS